MAERTPTLYEWAGGAPAFGRLTEVFYRRVKADPGYPHMMRKHLGRSIRPEQRRRWVELISEAADEAGMPDDPEFRSAFMAYVEWGSRIALANSQPGAELPPEAPVPHLGWGEAPPQEP